VTEAIIIAEIQISVIMTTAILRCTKKFTSKVWSFGSLLVNAEPSFELAADGAILWRDPVLPQMGLSIGENFLALSESTFP
jgi:hypothetical protein